ncbi:MAG: hypothetical protein LBK94_07070 [Prevotellaceae bacterium]|jgi:hypothetical protein|nr:hypothetical protein [Prevotellaceae bacterium]
MAERRKVYISIGEWQYKRKYRILYTGYVIGAGYAYVTRKLATVPYKTDLAVPPLFETRAPMCRLARDVFSYEIIMEQRLDSSQEAFDESFPEFEYLEKDAFLSAKLRTALWAVLHSSAAIDIGWYKYRSDNITTSAADFAGHKKILKNQPASFKGEGTEVNAFRHVLWQSYITNKYGYEMALQVGNVHEDNPDTNLMQRRVSSIKKADQIIDLLNNEIGRSIGGATGKKTVMNTLAVMVLDAFYEDGFYTAREEKNADGQVSYYIDRTTITDEQYRQLKELYGKLNEYGRTAEEQKKKDEKDKEDREKLERLQITWGTMK